MRKIISIRAIIIFNFIILILNSCSKISPSGFWKNFNSDLIQKKSSDQGPFGGTREIEWKNMNGKLKNKIFLKFANENGWKLIDSIEINSKTFPTNKLDKYTIEIIENELIPKLENQNSKIFIFETGWIRVKPGNEIETEQNGFLICENNGKNFKILQTWGE